jgi:hypothetical protein
MWQVEHDEETKTILVTAPDGKSRGFCDTVLPYLKVEVDEASGELRPVLCNGKPRVVGLCQAVSGQ